MLLLRVSFFNELENKNDTFESKVIILRETPFDSIVGRKTITRYNLFDKISCLSQVANAGRGSRVCLRAHEHDQDFTLVHG